MIEPYDLQVDDTPDGPRVTHPRRRELCRVVNAAAPGMGILLVGRLRRGEAIVLDGVRLASFELAAAPEVLRVWALRELETEDPERHGFVRLDGEAIGLYALHWAIATLQERQAEWARARSRAARVQLERDRLASIGLDPRFDLDDLETRARELDATTDEASASARRRFLLLDLQRHGILDVTRPFECAQPTIAGWRRAAIELDAYQRCAERAHLLPDDRVRPALFATLSLDWFRVPTPTPTGVVLSRLGWTAWCEHEARNFFESHDDLGPGRWSWMSGGHSHVFCWRRDNAETPALYRVT